MLPGIPSPGDNIRVIGQKLSPSSRAVKKRSLG
jgi:hypothetical protein